MIQPIRNQVLVECYEGDSETEAGIIVPDSVRKDSDRVRIIAVGNGTAKRAMKLKPGCDAIRVHGWGVPINEGDKKYLLMEDQAIIALQ